MKKNLFLKGFGAFVAVFAAMSAMTTDARAADQCSALNEIGEVAGNGGGGSGTIFTARYSGKGTITGKAQCSTRGVENIWYDNNDTFAQDHFTTTLPDSEGQYCYCQLDSWTPTSGSNMSLSAPWVFSYDAGSAKNCAKDCAYDCTDSLQNDEEAYLAFRAAMFEHATCPANGESNPTEVSSGTDNPNAGSGSNSGTSDPTPVEHSGTATTIKVATTRYNENGFSPVEADLATVRGTITSIVDSVISQASSINTLATTKQNRPNSYCPEEKKCLLIKDRSGNDNWYVIEDCSGDDFLSDVGAEAQFGGYYGGTKTTTATRSCAATDANCGNNQWMRSFANGLIYGEARAVQISESEGAVVTLPANVQSGNVCVCRATGYRVKDGTTYGNLVNVTTNYWRVSGTGVSDTACLTSCVHDGDAFGPDAEQSYYAGIANTCTVSVPEANMCLYPSFLATVATSGQSGGTGSGNWSSCQDPATSSFWSTSNYCGAANKWIARYTLSGGSADGYVFGRAGFVTVPNGTTTGAIVDASAYNVSDTYNSAVHNAAVCIIDGYKNGTNAEQSFGGSAQAYVFVRSSGTNNFAGFMSATDGSYAGTACAELAGSASSFDNFYNSVADMCLVY